MDTAIVEVMAVPDRALYTLNIKERAGMERKGNMEEKKVKVKVKAKENVKVKEKEKGKGKKEKEKEKEKATPLIGTSRTTTIGVAAPAVGATIVDNQMPADGHGSIVVEDTPNRIMTATQGEVA